STPLRSSPISSRRPSACADHEAAAAEAFRDCNPAENNGNIALKVRDKPHLRRSPPPHRRGVSISREEHYAYFFTSFAGSVGRGPCPHHRRSAGAGEAQDR